jgi:homoserine kinase
MGAHVRVPATSANLGPGFDALGLALSWYDDVSAVRSGSVLQVDVSGACADDVPRDESHLSVRAMDATFAELGEERGGLVLRCENSIPHGIGIGSSAAAVVAGVLLARALAHEGADRLDDQAVLGLAARFEVIPTTRPPQCSAASRSPGRSPRVRRAPRARVSLRAVVLLDHSPPRRLEACSRRASRIRCGARRGAVGAARARDHCRS